MKSENKIQETIEKLIADGISPSVKKVQDLIGGNTEQIRILVKQYKESMIKPDNSEVDQKKLPEKIKLSFDNISKIIIDSIEEIVNQELSEKIEEIASINKDMDILANDMAKLRDSNNKLTETNNALTLENSKIKQEAEISTTDLKIKNETLNVSVNKLQLENAELKSKIDQFNKEKLQMETNLNKSIDENKGLKTMLEKTENRLEVTEKKYETLVNKMVEVKTLKPEKEK